MKPRNKRIYAESRRGFLRRGAGLTALIAAPAVAQPLTVPDWMRVQGRPILDPAYGVPSRFQAARRVPFPGTPTATAAASLTPLADLHGIITPNGLVFERHHAGIPDIDPDAHRLVVHGLVQRPLVFTMDDLLRLPSVSRIHFLECSGNTLSEWRGPKGDTAQQTHGLLSCCEWTGVLLSTVLEEAGLAEGARWILAEGADAAAMTRSVPIEKALDDAMLVYAQNGEWLRPEQGYPLRLFLPGFEGNMSVKWLRRLKVGSAPFMTREETAKYTDLMPDGTARQFSFVMEAKSVVLKPSGGTKRLERGYQQISGVAWSGRGHIAAVDVTTDGGRSWQRARLEEPVRDKCLTRFYLDWRWEGTPARIASRARDNSGYLQPTREQLVNVRGSNS
ncbi:MAG: sulfite dehydrogenase, partial [Burkholderiales bacterium]